MISGVRPPSSRREVIFRPCNGHLDSMSPACWSQGIRHTCRLLSSPSSRGHGGGGGGGGRGGGGRGGGGGGSGFCGEVDWDVASWNWARARFLRPRTDMFSFAFLRSALSLSAASLSLPSAMQNNSFLFWASIQINVCAQDFCTTSSDTAHACFFSNEAPPRMAAVLCFAHNVPMQGPAHMLV